MGADSNTGTVPSALYIYGEADVYNNIFWNPDLTHEIKLSVPSGGTGQSIMNFGYNDINGGMAGILQSGSNPVLNWYDGNISANPQFVGGEPYSYELTADSPCRNAGTPDTTGMGLPTLDLAGKARVWEGRIDMGCYEYGSVNTHDHITPALNNYNLRNYPNPVFMFSKSRQGSGYTTFEFDLTEPLKKKAEIQIFNIRGQKVKTIEVTTNIYKLAQKAGVDVRGKYSANNYTDIWDCRGDNQRPVPCGVYLYRLVADGKPLAIKKLMVVR